MRHIKATFHHKCVLPITNLQIILESSLCEPIKSNIIIIVKLETSVFRFSSQNLRAFWKAPCYQHGGQSIVNKPPFHTHGQAAAEGLSCFRCVNLKGAQTTKSIKSQVGCRCLSKPLTSGLFEFSLATYSMWAMIRLWVNITLSSEGDEQMSWVILLILVGAKCAVRHDIVGNLSSEIDSIMST